MKHLFSTVLIFSLALTSCSLLGTDDKDSGDSFISCKVDGVEFNAVTATVGGVNQNSVLTVQGNGSGLSANAITIQLQGTYTGPGIYQLGEEELFNLGTYLPKVLDSDNIFSSASSGFNAGQIEITKDADGVVEGTFNFKATKQDDNSVIINITEGKFRTKPL